MKKILLYILILSLVPQAAGFAQYAAHDLIISGYLVELDYHSNDETAMVKETIVFSNMKDTNYSEDVRIAIPESAEVMHVMRMGHETNASSAMVDYDRNGEILRWNATLAPGGMAMYSVTYTVPITKSGEFVKKLVYPAVVNYPIASFRLKVNTDDHVKFTDEAGNVLEPDKTETGDDGVLYSWTNQVIFHELHIKLSQPSSMDKWIVGAVLALVILSALLYPILHVRNSKMREKDGGANLSCTSCASRSVCENEEKKAGDWEEMEGIVTEVTHSKEDLIRKKKAILAVLDKLEADHDSGEVSDEDYARLSSKYEKQAVKIMKQLDRI